MKQELLEVNNKGLKKSKNNAVASTDVKENTQPRPATHTRPPDLYLGAAVLPCPPPDPHPTDGPDAPSRHPLPCPVYMPVFPPCVPSANNFVNS